MTENTKNTTALFFEGQGLNLISLAVLFVLMMPAWRNPIMEAGELWGLTSRQWFVFTIINAIIHQAWVWLWWRGELYYKFPSRLFGRYAFEIYATGFVVLISLRFLLGIALSVANSWTVEIPHGVSIWGSMVLLLPLIYLVYSIHRYFGVTRVFGLDHFDESYRKKPLVKEGIFRYFSNPMYTFGMLMLWIPAVYMASFAALVSALFCHIYIWVHYFGTERPDMRRIYRV
jgi:protein-S-isoprenylcysteine O-methyltransferase Ste14